MMSLHIQLVVVALAVSVACAEEHHGKHNATAANPTTTAGKFTQNQCMDSSCFFCDGWVYDQNTCLQATEGFYAVGECVPDGFKQTVYETAGCTGTPYSQKILDVNVCYQGVDGRYFENVCDGSKARKANVTSKHPADGASPALLLS